MFSLPQMDDRLIDQYLESEGIVDADEQEFVRLVLARAHRLVAKEHEDAVHRLQHPQLQALWDEYQVTLALLRESPFGPFQSK